MELLAAADQLDFLFVELFVDRFKVGSAAYLTRGNGSCRPQFLPST